MMTTTTAATTRAQLTARRDQLVSDLCQLHLDALGASQSGDAAGEAEAAALMTAVQAEISEIAAALAQHAEPEPEQESAPEPDRAAFAAWLAEKEDAAIVGRGSSRSQCPLATYLTETERPAEGAWIEVDYLTWDVISRGSLASHDLPAWAIRFAEAIDAVYPASPITAAAARATLDGIKGKRSH